MEAESVLGLGCKVIRRLTYYITIMTLLSIFIERKSKHLQENIISDYYFVDVTTKCDVKC